MVKNIEKFSSALHEASKITSGVLEQGETDVAKALQLADSINKNDQLRVPFVGDFSSGKSSLLNAMMGRDLLPTDITPLTAVSYELRYAPNEKLELFNNDQKVSDHPISDIGSLKVKPGDKVVVYVNNQVIKKYEEKGILLVDMPGIDSGIENHNAAINQYLGPGTFYMVFSDAEQGTFRNSSLSFINEITQYKGVDFAAFFSKADKKDESVIIEMKEQADGLFSRKFNGSKTVGVTSATEKRFEDVTKVLDSINIEDLIYKRYHEEVKDVINEMIITINRNIKLLSGDIKNADSAIQKIENQRKEALEALENQRKDAQPLDDSIQDIINDIKNALVSNSAMLASKMLAKGSNEELSNEFVQVIRPVLINSFSREISEYQEVISSVISQMTDDLEKIMQEEGLMGGIQDQILGMLGKEAIDKMLQNGLAKLAAKVAGKKGLSTLVSLLGKTLGPMVTILVYLLPDIIGMIFGKSKSKKLQEFQHLISSQIASKIAEGLRPEIKKTLQEQRDAMDKAASEMINAETAKIDAEIRHAIKMHEEQKENLEKKIEELKSAVEQLTSITNEILL